MDFWNNYYIPVQDENPEAESINPADAFRRQAEVINFSGPLYAELEVVEAQLKRAQRVEDELKRRILAQGMADLSGTKTRTSDLVDAYVFTLAEWFELNGITRDIRPQLLRLRRRISRLEVKRDKIQRRLRALADMAETCQKTLDWVKHSDRLELSGIYRDR